MARRKAELARGREAAAAQQVGHCKLRQSDGKGEVGGGSGSMTTGAMQQPAGKQEANGRGGVSGQEAVERREDERRRRCNVRRHNNQLE